MGGDGNGEGQRTQRLIGGVLEDDKRKQKAYKATGGEQN